MNKWIRLAGKIAARSRHPHHQLGAVVVRGGAVLSSAENLPTRGRHAETRAIGRRRYPDATLVVVRLGGRISRPCPNCLAAIRAAGIRSVLYIDQTGAPAWL